LQNEIFHSNLFYFFFVMLEKMEKKKKNICEKEIEKKRNLWEYAKSRH